MDIVFSFAVETKFEQKKVVDKQFYLTLTQYPIKKMIRINKT